MMMIFKLKHLYLEELELSSEEDLLLSIKRNLNQPEELLLKEDQLTMKRQKRRSTEGVAKR